MLIYNRHFSLAIKNMSQGDMFSQQEAVQFLQNSWSIKDVLKRLKNDRKNLVDEIVVQILARIPFQSIALMAKPAEERNCPTYEEIKARGKSGTVQLQLFAKNNQ